MRTALLGVWLCLAAGCSIGGGLSVEMDCIVRPGEATELAELKTNFRREYTIRVRNVGPENSSSEPGEIEVWNGDQALGRVPVGKVRTFEASGERVTLKIRALGGPTRVEGSVRSVN